MYDELIQRLHRYSENCVAYKLDADFADAVQQAADAIEELSRENESLGKDLTSAVEMLKKKRKPKWIPVTERLPEEYKDVLCYYEYFRYGDYNCMFRTIDRGYYGNGRWGGEAGQGHKNKVLAWMPLPEPPEKEV